VPKVGLKEREGLTPKQAEFVVQYILLGNATQAALAAGYSQRGAGQQGGALLKNPQVVAEIEAKSTKLAAAREVKVAITKELLLNEAMATYQEAREEGDYGPARGLLELMAKMQGHIVERKDVRMIARIEDLRDEELEAIVAQSQRDKQR